MSRGAWLPPVCVYVAAHHFVNCLKTVMMVVMEFVEGGSLSSYLEKLRVSQRFQLLGYLPAVFSPCIAEL